MKYADLYLKVKNNFYKIFTTCYAQIRPKIKNAQNLLKVGTLDSSHMPISILLSKVILTKYLPSPLQNQNFVNTKKNTYGK